MPDRQRSLETQGDTEKSRGGLNIGMHHLDNFLFFSFNIWVRPGMALYPLQ